MQVIESRDRAHRTRRFTVDEVLRMVEAGILHEDESLELIEGELIEVTPQGPQHASRIAAISRLLAGAYERLGHHVRVQSPLEAGVVSLPEPDLAVTRGAPGAYGERHPRGDDVVLLVEAAVSSQEYDRRKARIYARAGVREYWLVDLAARRLEAHREPSEAGYERIEVLAEGKDVALPETDTVVSVRELVG